MKSRNTLIAALLLLSLVALGFQTAQSQSVPSPINASLKAPSDETELVSFVESAVAHVKEVGKERAIKDFMDLNGTWVRGDVYIFAQSFNGTSLVLPYTPSGVGTNRLDLQDARGTYINRDMYCLALNGGGFYHYVYKNPVSGLIQNKVSYVMKVDESWWLGAGIYEGNQAAGSNQTSLEVSLEGAGD